MNYLLTFVLFGVCFTGMALGVIFAQKVLRKGCSVDPADPNATCACKEEEKKARLNADDNILNIQPNLKSKKRF